tara:strand:+ start:3973 stop:4146 length:174 start_codon:yes stop_codon:yes gene_type:complete
MGPPVLPDSADFFRTPQGVGIYGIAAISSSVFQVLPRNDPFFSEERDLPWKNPEDVP